MVDRFTLMFRDHYLLIHFILLILIPILFFRSLCFAASARRQGVQSPVELNTALSHILQGT